MTVVDHGPEFLDLWMKVVSSHVRDQRISTILELGCGTGRFSEGLPLTLWEKSDVRHRPRGNRSFDQETISCGTNCSTASLRPIDGIAVGRSEFAGH
jgi:hypothetical protein